MPKIVPISIFNIARTTVDRKEVKDWLDYLNVNDFHIPNEQEISDPALVIALAAKRCYMSFEPGLNPNVTKVRKDIVAYFDNLLSSKHGSVLEHAVYTFAIEGVSRVFTAEMNRHRAGWAVSEGSLRFIRFDKEIPYWLPTSLTVNENDDQDLRERKKISQAIFNQVFATIEDAYSALLHIWNMDKGNQNFDYKKKVTSCLRRIIPLGVATGGVWTGNIRALRHVISLRTDPSAEEEIFHVFSRIAKIIIEKEPLLFMDFENKGNGSFVPKYWKV
jgi:thymidylate synthase (FAD)